MTKGMAFVEFASKDDAQRAIDMAKASAAAAAPPASEDKDGLFFQGIPLQTMWKKKWIDDTIAERAERTEEDEDEISRVWVERGEVCVCVCLCVCTESSEAFIARSLSCFQHPRASFPCSGRAPPALRSPRAQHPGHAARPQGRAGSQDGAQV